MNLSPSFIFTYHPFAETFWMQFAFPGRPADARSSNRTAL